MHDQSFKRPPIVRSIALQNFLSFGPDSCTLELRDLNVLIGPNGSGKSNLLEAFVLLRGAANGLREVILEGGGVSEWIWKGARAPVASIDVVLENPNGSQPIRHVLQFREETQRFRLDDERIENEQPMGGNERPYFFYQYDQGHPVVNVAGQRRGLKHEDVEPDASIIAQRRDPETYPEITFIGKTYSNFAMYREWEFGRSSVFRTPQKTDMPNDRLREDFANLGLFLNRLEFTPGNTKVLDGLRDLYPGFTNYRLSIQGGTVQIFFVEGSFTIPATRLSDGTLRYLCLLAILCDPDPPRLICIEEPELGLHPDVLPKLADIIVDAATRTQLIVTTHSDILVDALTERPESVVVCEKKDGQTSMRRLKREQLSVWLEKYRLGELWTKGELGGTRW